MSKSAKIRELAAQGLPKGEIAKIVGIRYQFVYNVLKNEQLKKLDQENKQANEAK